MSVYFSSLCHVPRTRIVTGRWYICVATIFLFFVSVVSTVSELLLQFVQDNKLLFVKGLVSSVQSCKKGNQADYTTGKISARLDLYASQRHACISSDKCIWQVIGSN